MKNSIRKEIRKKRENMTQEEVISKSKAVTEKFLNSEWFKNSNTIMSYISIKNEIDLQEINETIIKLGKTLVLPVISNA